MYKVCKYIISDINRDQYIIYIIMYVGHEVNLDIKLYKQNNILVMKKETIYENITFKLIIIFNKLIY
jgi:hypothetical protein